MVNLVRIVARLSELVDEETAALRNGNHAMLSDFNYRKGHGFLELNRALSSAPQSVPADAAVVRMVEELRTKLEKNRAVLQVHLDAVNEVAGVLSNAIREAESDGTYTQTTWRAGDQK